MEVRFKRTGERRYAITIFRESHPTIEMNPAPGYDPIMPHDLAHLIVERELGLRRGVFGQIAAGGNAGTFHVLPVAGENKRGTARLRRKVTRRGETLLREGREDAALSERAVHLCQNEWLSRLTVSNPRKLVANPSSQSKLLSAEDTLLTDEALNRVCASLDWASEQWKALQVGESFSVLWPVGPK